MNKNDSMSKPTCSRCRSDAMILKSRAHAGDTRTDDVIRTEMIGCAVIYRYMVCDACGKNMTRAEYESFQKGGHLL
jgi:NMD protein affecting ribosome stability and mRNA decay